MELKELLEGLLSQIRGGMEPFLSYDDVRELPPEQFEAMQRIKVLVETSPAKYFTCRECPDEDCDMISLTIDTDRKTGKQMGFFLCQKERGVGLKKVELERLRRWEILPDKIEAHLAPKVEEPAKIPEEIKGKTNPEQEDVCIADWDRLEDKTKVCKWIHQKWIKRGKPKKAEIIREALSHFGLPKDYYHRVRKELNKLFNA
jgi:hypothetical protein